MSKKNAAPKNTYRIENRDMHTAMLGFRRSSATSPQDSRPNRERSRQDSKRAAIRNGGW